MNQILLRNIFNHGEGPMDKYFWSHSSKVDYNSPVNAKQGPNCPSQSPAFSWMASWDLANRAQAAFFVANWAPEICGPIWLDGLLSSIYNFGFHGHLSVRRIWIGLL